MDDIHEIKDKDYFGDSITAEKVARMANSGAKDGFWISGRGGSIRLRPFNNYLGRVLRLQSITEGILIT